LTALKIIGIILLIFLLIGFIRLGAVISFGDALRVQLRIWMVRLTIYPRKSKKKKKPSAGEKQEKPAAEKKPKAGKKHSIPKPTLSELIDLAETALAALRATLRRTCKRVCIDPLELTAVFGGWDPSKTATYFGAANTLMYAIMPRAEETFYIPDPSLHLRLNYDQEQLVTAKGSLGISLRICDLFAILFTLAIPLIKWFLRVKCAHRHDKPEQEQSTEEQTPNTEQQSA